MLVEIAVRECKMLRAGISGVDCGKFAEVYLLFDGKNNLPLVPFRPGD